MKVIFLAGVHGVGKGFLGAPASQALGMEHITASELIREEKGLAGWSADKRVADIRENQIALVRAVQRRRQNGRYLLLDGHFVLRGKTGELVSLEIDVFAELRLSGVILLTDDAHVIANRIATRDAISIGLDAITELAAAEYAHAHEVCRALEIPLSILCSADSPMVMEAILRFLQNDAT